MAIFPVPPQIVLKLDFGSMVQYSRYIRMVLDRYLSQVIPILHFTLTYTPLAHFEGNATFDLNSSAYSTGQKVTHSLLLR